MDANRDCRVCFDTDTVVVVVDAGATLRYRRVERWDVESDVSSVMATSAACRQGRQWRTLDAGRSVGHEVKRTSFLQLLMCCENSP